MFTILAMHGVNINAAGAYFVETVDKVRQCEPNYKFFGLVKDNIWILKDLFPGTPIMFKMTLVYQTAEAYCKYHKIDAGSAHCYGDKIWVNVKIAPPKINDKVMVPYAEAQKYLMAKADNILLGGVIEPESFMKHVFNVPRRMFPKGYSHENRPNKRPTHIHDKRTRRRKNVQRNGD